MKRDEGKPDELGSLTLSRLVSARTLDSSVENRFSAVKISKPSSSSSSPELAESFGSTVLRCDGRELLSLCIVWNRGSSESLSRPSEVWRLSLENAESSSASFSVRRELILRGRPRRVFEPNPAVVLVALDSDGSRLLDRGVTKPPPSTAIGIINSRGLFLIGMVVPLLLTDALPGNEGIWLCDAVVSESFDSLVDCRDSEPRAVPNAFEDVRW